MYIKYNIYTGVARLKSRAQQLSNRFAIGITAGMAALGLVIVPIASAHGYSHWSSLHRSNHSTVVYDNIPDPQPSNVPSLGYEATSTSEFGGQAKLADNDRKDPTVTVLMSSWACKSGTWNDKNCVTNRGSKFEHPVTLNLYEVNDDNSPGDLIATKTKTFKMPYRPTMDDGTNCSGDDAGKWWDGEACVNGKAFTIKFNFAKDVVLPDNVIVGVSYDTTHNGETPLGETTDCYGTDEGCPYDALNVGTNPEPTVGMAQPTNNDAYLSSTWTGAYCDSGVGGTGEFRLDAGCWTGYLPAFQITANGHGKYDKHYNKHHGNHKHHNKKHHKNNKNDDWRHKDDNGRSDRKHGFYSAWNR